MNIIYAITIFSSKNFYDIFKNIVQRQRPPLELLHYHQLDDFSFPSGHSYNIMILFGVLIYIIFKYSKNNIIKYSSAAICTIMIMLVGLSRLLLGVHYPTDVIAGFLLGLTTVFTICIIDKQISSDKN
ncbi:phosphatase PAP2 family protein [bacterium]|nr:phosphatase PAP2 family protein [bacterium]